MPNNTAESVILPPRLDHFYGKVHGTPAPFAQVSVNTEMDISQRKFYPEKILDYIKKHEGLNWKTFGYVTVVKYPDGTERMINGRHRTSVAITVDSTITHVPAHIVDVANEEEAAILFAAMNGESSKNLTTEELFWSTVIAKDPDSLAIKQVLETCGLACGKVNEFDAHGHPNIQVKLANFKKCLNFGKAETIEIVKLIRIAYPKATAFDNLLSGATRLVTMKEYNGLLDTSSALGKDFEFWFTERLHDSHELKDTNFRKYRNTTQWFNGVAFGLYEVFVKFMKARDKKNYPSIKAIKKVYEDGIIDDED